MPCEPQPHSMCGSPILEIAVVQGKPRLRAPTDHFPSPPLPPPRLRPPAAGQPPPPPSRSTGRQTQLMQLQTQQEEWELQYCQQQMRLPNQPPRANAALAL